jgi:D-alanyl-D-alanine carboxypeptidase/D-alanyl-D-alanine-endopeptidase (penicillin-binding protein 4)
VTIPRHPERSAAGAQSKGLVAAVLLVAMLATSQRAIAAPTPIVQPAIGGTPWTADEIAKLDRALDTMLATDPALHGAHYGVYAVDSVNGTALYSHAVDDEIQPASTFKLLVGSAALDRLTPNFLWTTTAARTSSSDAKPPNVILVASGDPTLAMHDLDDAAAAFPGTKLGTVLVDDSAFDERPYPAGWTWDDFGEDYAPSVSAATLDENVIVMRVSPGSTVGDPARVTYADGRPDDRDYGMPCDAYASSSAVVYSRVTTGPASSEDTVDATQDLGRCAQIVGSIPLGAAPETIAVSMFRPILNMRDALSRALAARKVEEAGSFRVIDGVFADGVRLSALGSDATTFWTHDSQPLAALLGPRFWIPSDNLFAELLLKELGLVTAGKPGTTDTGIAYEKQWLQRIGIDPATVTLADGCGMSQYDRITPRDLVTILQHDWNGPNRQLVLDSLPVGGARGTIEGIAGTDAAGRVFAKTGSMMHVRGLAGYLATLHHGPVTFAFEVDDWNGAYPALAALRARVLSRIIDD